MNHLHNAWNQGKYKDQFKIEDGVQSAEKFLTSSIEEIKIALRAMGKRSLKELSKNDLVSYDELTAKMVGIPFPLIHGKTKTRLIKAIFLKFVVKIQRPILT